MPKSLPAPAAGRRRRSGPALILGIALVSLAGCGRHHQRAADTDSAVISFGGIGNAGDGGSAGADAQTVSIAVPGFAAKLNVPGVELGGADTTIGGIRLHPGTKVVGMRIAGAAGDGSGGEGHGNVTMRFTDPTPPDQLLGYYRQSAKQAGWTEIPPAAGQQFAATKHHDEGSAHLAMVIGAGVAGSTGTFLVTGS